jgi:nitrous oxidase accessory protein NosD
MLRLAALGIVGLGSALLIAALLLSTYTSGKIRKIPLNIDQTLTSAGTGTALDPASLQAGPGERFVIDKNVPLVSQQAMTVETPANAEVVTFQVGTTVRRCWPWSTP